MGRGGGVEGGAMRLGDRGRGGGRDGTKTKGYGMWIGLG